MVGLVLRTHLGTFLVPSRPHLIGEIIQLLCRYVGGAGRLVGGCGVVGGVLVQLGRSVSIFWSVGSDCHSFGLYPHHDRFSLKHSDFFPQVPVGLTTTCTVTRLSNHTNYTVCQLFNSCPVQISSSIKYSEIRKMSACYLLGICFWFESDEPVVILHKLTAQKLGQAFALKESLHLLHNKKGVKSNQNQHK